MTENEVIEILKNKLTTCKDDIDCNFKKALLLAIKILETNKWIEVPDNCKDSIFEEYHVGIFPDNYEHVLVTLEYKDDTGRMLNVKEVMYTKGNWDEGNKTKGNWTIKAWKPMPTAWKPLSEF